DDPQKQGNDIHGIRVRGTLADIPRLIVDMDIDIVLIAMSEASRAVLDSVVSMSAEAGATCRIVPSISELADGRVTVSRLRSVTVEDLLGRDPICLDEASILGYLEGHVVLVTGGGGSIGSELSRQIALHSPELLLIIDHSEFNLYRIERELRQDFPGLKMHFLLGDVTNERAVRRVFGEYGPSVVFHAAAYKHVPMLEGNIAEGIRNNVFGTRIVAETAVEFGSERFVLVSTDKTVNPANVMGATKRVAEIICQNLGRRTATQFITTRFGNVLGSAGSVVPLFEAQIAAGGPVTVTHPDVTRYFMTISEATSLILQAGAMGQGGEIYVMDMGKPVSIRVLAEKLIQLSGLKPYRDIELEFTGLRPGEKLHEELFYSGEELLSTPHPKLLLADSFVVDLGWLRARLDELRAAVEAYDIEGALACLRVLIPEFSQRQGQSTHAKPNLRSVN
ncbi:MAG: nucleoside-diphosphate sugar epimerase/dehydratase, partial [Rhodothermales bacterium]